MLVVPAEVSLDSSLSNVQAIIRMVPAQHSIDWNQGHSVT